LFGLFGKSKAETPIARQPLDTPIPWRSDTSLPIPDWSQLTQPPGAQKQELDDFWSSAAFTWLKALQVKLGDGYEIAESEQFMLFGALSQRTQQLALDYAEKTRMRVLNVLDGVASDDGYGKFVMLVLRDYDTYYEYIANYYSDVPDSEELALSSGMYINYGYGHFVFVEEDLDRVEPVIAHELTHGLLAHLPLPAWVNEGIAVSTERRLCPRSRSDMTPFELQSQFSTFWNSATIQEFWSGKSWLRPDEGNSLSYELATTLVSLAAKDDWQRFARFVNAAAMSDAGDGAAREHLGLTLSELAAAVLGPGDWSPNPAAWKQGTERGQF
jgi:hypothetical protein